jgi:hypothetical protein
MPLHSIIIATLGRADTLSVLIPHLYFFFLIHFKDGVFELRRLVRELVLFTQMATVYLSDSVGVQFEKSCFSRRNFGTKI